jgi:hypothetical protein
MSIPFTQSMHSLHVDHGRFSLLSVSVAIVLVLLWGLWFFIPSVTIYATGNLVKINRDGNLVAQFASHDRDRLQPGQAAKIRLPTAQPKQGASLSATLLEIAPTEADDHIEVILYSTSYDTNDMKLLVPGNSSQVEVEVETISPALLLMRVSGQYIDTPPVSLSPQQ